MAYCVLTFLMRLTAVWNIFPAVLRSKRLLSSYRPACATTALAGICVLLALYFYGTLYVVDCQCIMVLACRSPSCA